MMTRIQRILMTSVIVFSAALAGAETPRLFELAPGDTPRLRGLGAAWRVAIDEGLVTAGSAQLRLDLPDGLEVVAQRRQLTRRGVDSALWQGRLTGTDRGEVILSLTEGVLSGYLSTEYGEYEIRPLAGGDYMVAKIEADQLTGCDTPIATAPLQGDQPVPAPSPPLAADGPGSLDILVLFTPEARDTMGGRPQINSRIQMMVDTANTAYQNSQMSARLNLVHTAVSTFSESGDGEADLVKLRTNNQARSLREQYQADLVALIVSESEGLCGIAYVLPTLEPWFADFAFSLTHLSCIPTFAHEVGHNLGMQHDPANSDPDFEAVFPGGFGHFVSGDFRTVMAYPDPCGICVQVLNFSNPRVSRNGIPLGITNQRDNARLGNLTAPVVANYRLSGVVLQDDFESGALSAWALNRGSMRVVEPGLGGSGFALEIPLTGTASRRFVMHRVGEPGLGVNSEFVLNVGNAALGTSEVEILSLLGRGERHTALRVRQTGGTYWAILYARANTGPYREVARTPLRADFDEILRVEWQRATGPGIADGFVRLVKNGGNRGAVRDLLNDEWPVREVRLGIPSGAVGVPPGGALLVDNYRASIPVVEEPATE